MGVITLVMKWNHGDPIIVKYNIAMIKISVAIIDPKPNFSYYVKRKKKNNGRRGRRYSRKGVYEGRGWKQAGLISRWRGSLIGAELRERADNRG